MYWLATWKTIKIILEHIVIRQIVRDGCVLWRAKTVVNYNTCWLDIYLSVQYIY